MARLQGPVQLVMQRRTMRGIKERAEGARAPWTATVLEPAAWLGCAAAALAGAAGTLAARRAWWRPLVATAAATTTGAWLAFRTPP
jgi:hypothetical protein